MLASVDVNFLFEGIAGALLQHAFRYSCRSRSAMCYAFVCFKNIFALVCLLGCWCCRDRVFFAAATWSLAETSSSSSQQLPSLLFFFLATATYLLVDTDAFTFVVATWTFQMDALLSVAATLSLADGD